MSMVNAYGAYQSSYYNSGVKGAREQDIQTNKAPIAAAHKTEKEDQQPKLSNAAQKLLEELREKYGNMDIMAAGFDSQEEAQSYLSRGTKEYSVLINVDELERLAASRDGKEKLVSQIDNSVAQLQNMKEQLGEEGQDVKSLGVSFGQDGQVSYFAELEKSSAAQRERIDKSRAEKKAEKKAQDKKAHEKEAEEKRAGKGKEPHGPEYDSVKRTTVRADSMEELLEQIRNVDWDNVKETGDIRGTRFDFTV